MKFNVCFVWTVIYVYFSELFPTQIRSLALGMTSAGGTIGSSSAPYIVFLCNKILKINPMIALGIIAVLGFFHVIKLKETKGKPIEN